MKCHPASNGLWAFLALSFFAVLSACYRNGEQILVPRPSHHSRVLNRAVFISSASTPDDEYDSPAAYDFGNPDASTGSNAPYPVPTASLGGGGESSSDHSSTLGEHSSTATTEPRSPGVSNGPEIESTSTAVGPKSSNGGTLPSSAASPFHSSQDSGSKTDANRNETVTVTVTNFVTSKPTQTGITDALPSSGAQTSVKSSTSSKISDSNVSVITVTSLHTITLSIGRTSSPIEQTTPSPSESENNATSTAGTTTGQNSISAGPLASSGASIITITRTETYTSTSNTTADATDSGTFKEVSTSTIEWPTPISRIPPFSASFNLSSIPGPVISSHVSGAATSLRSTPPESTTRTVFQNITVTLSEFPETESPEAEATRTAAPTKTGGSNVTHSVSSTQSTGTFPPVSTSTSSLSIPKSTVNATVVEIPAVSISTDVVTITVYPTPPEATTSTNGTSVVTLHNSSTTTVTITPYPLSNASSSTFPTVGGFTTTSSGPFTAGGTVSWSTSLSTVSTNSSVIGTLLNTTTTWASTDSTRPAYADTTCEHTHTTFQPAYTTGARATNSPSSTGIISNETVAYPPPSTFRTTVSPTSSAEDDGTSAYPSPSSKRLPGSPSYPWGGSGPLHRLQEPSF